MMEILTFTSFTIIQARPLYEAYVLGSVSVLTRCYCSVFIDHEHPSSRNMLTIVVLVKLVTEFTV